MIVVDIESTWLDTQNCSILSIWAVCFEKPSKQFYWECRIWDWALVIQEWLDVNGFTHEQITDEAKQTEAKLVQKFLNWMEQFPNKIIAGQHPMALDVPILKSACNRAWINHNFSHKTIDLHSLACWYFLSKWIELDTKEDWNSNISLDTIAEYFGLWEEPQPHNALTGALYETECFYNLIHWKSAGLL